MNLYEIRLEDNIIYNDTLLDAFLFDCQCALFLVDKTNPDSFDKVKTIISFIKDESYPNLKKIIVENKSDINTDELNEELEKYINENSKSYIEYIKISLKTEDNLDNLLVKIYDGTDSNNSEKPILPIDRIAKCILKDFPKAPSVRSLSFILIGDSNVGKTNFLSRYIKNSFNLIFVSSINSINNEQKMIMINNKNFYEITIWDTAGQERFRSLPKTYYRNADGILLLFNINDKSTFEDVNKWMSDVNENIDRGEEGEEKDIVIYILGNKIDLIDNDDEDANKEEEKKEKVTKEEIEELANKLKVKYYDISCKWNLNIDEVMARIILDCTYKNRQRRKTFVITQKEIKAKSKKKGGCCDKKDD